MRSFLLLAALAPLALAAPLNVNNVNTNAVARAEQGLALRDAGVSIDNSARQLAPGGLANVDLQAIIGEVTKALQGVVGLTGDQLKTIVSIVEGILSGKGIPGDAIPKLLSVPSSILAKLPGILDPILTPATAGLPAIAGVVKLLMNLLKTLGGILGGLGGLTAGLGGLTKGLGGRDLLEGVDINAILGDITGGLKGTGLGDDALKTILDLVSGLLSGKPLDTALLTKLTALPVSLLGTVIGVLNGIVSKLPIVGPLLAPLLTVLQLLLVLGPGILGGLVSGATGAVGGVAGGVTGGKGGLLGLA